MLEYRTAFTGDIDELLRVRLDFMRDVRGAISSEDEKALYESNRSYITNALTNGSFIQWLATDNGVIAATCSLSLYMLPPNMSRINGKAGYIANVFTYPAYRGRGLATRLLELAVQSAKDAGCRQIFLDATDMGRPIYDKLGFRAAEHAMVMHV